MKFSIKAALRFLFPEMQIVDAVKQEGFIAKKLEKYTRLPHSWNTVQGCHITIQKPRVLARNG